MSSVLRCEGIGYAEEMGDGNEDGVKREFLWGKEIGTGRGRSRDSEGMGEKLSLLHGSDAQDLHGPLCASERLQLE